MTPEIEICRGIDWYFDQRSQMVAHEPNFT